MNNKLNKNLKKIKQLLNYSASGMIIEDNDIIKILEDIYNLGKSDGYAERFYEELETKK
jgi:hypothetical protein